MLCDTCRARGADQIRSVADVDAARAGGWIELDDGAAGSGLGPRWSCAVCQSGLGLPADRGVRVRVDELYSDGARALLEAQLRDGLPGFELGKRLGRGGMGVLYRGRERATGRAVVIKIMAPRKQLDDEMTLRFGREVAALALLQHPNIVELVAQGAVPGRLCFVMEQVPGPDLARVIRGGPVAPQRAVAIVHAVCSGLAHAHAHGLVHRDLKPANVLLDPTSVAKVADFGLVKQLQGFGDEVSVTATDEVVGTPLYTAPEARAGIREVTPQLDVYGVGMLLSALLTGQQPREPIHRAPPLTNVPPALAAIVEGATRADPAQRTASMQQLMEQLQRSGFMEARAGGWWRRFLRILGVVRG